MFIVAFDRVSEQVRLSWRLESCAISASACDPAPAFEDGPKYDRIPSLLRRAARYDGQS